MQPHPIFKLDIIRRNQDGSTSEFHVSGEAEIKDFTEQELGDLLVGTEIFLNAQGNPRFHIWLDNGEKVG